MKNNYLEIFKSVKTKYPEDWNYFVNVIWKPLMSVEGGGKLHKISKDSGGYTKFGISYNNNRTYFNGINDFFTLKEDESQLLAFSIYYVNAYVPLVSKDAQDVFFDISFNMGASRAVRFAQSCLGLKVDGICGVITKANLKNLTEDCLTKKRVSFYYSLLNLKKFLQGWLNRVSIISKID